MNYVPAHELTWDAILAFAEKKKAVTTIEGYVLCSQDRKLNVPEAYNRHFLEVKRALEEGRNVPLAVATAHKLILLEKERFGWGTNYPPAYPNNKKNKPFSWSHTAIAQFKTCPMQYAGSRYYMTVAFEETEAIRWGNLVHKALELRLKRGTKLPKEMQKWEKYCLAFEQAAEKNDGKIYPEIEMCITRNFHLTDWFSKQAWGRGKLDVLIDCGDTIYIYDWKTGKKKDDPDQLRTSAAFAALKFPDAKRYVTKFVWLQHDGADAVSGDSFDASEIPVIWDSLLERLTTMVDAWRHEQFPCKTSGLCYGWCQVTDCEHWRPKK